MLLLTAAAEQTGDPVVLWRAAGQLGVEAGAGGTGDRRRAHRVPRAGTVLPSARPGRGLLGGPAPAARSASTAPLRTPPTRTLDPDRRAWHLAHAAPGLDEDVAAELERSAGRARARGGLAAAAAFAERAAELTPDPARRARRALAAAQAKYQAGAPDAALRLLAMAQAGPLDDLGRARAELLRAQLAAGAGRGRDAWLLLIKAANRLEPLDAGLAREAYRDAFSAALTTGRLGPPRRNPAGRRGGTGGTAGGQPSQADRLLLDGLAVLITEGHAAGAPLMKRALSAFRNQEALADDGARRGCRSRAAWPVTPGTTTSWTCCRPG